MSGHEWRNAQVAQRRQQCHAVRPTRDGDDQPTVVVERSQRPLDLCGQSRVGLSRHDGGRRWADATGARRAVTIALMSRSVEMGILVAAALCVLAAGVVLSLVAARRGLFRSWPRARVRAAPWGGGTCLVAYVILWVLPELATR